MSGDREIPAEDSIKVVCRFRPLNDSEERAGSKFIVKFPSGPEENCLSIGVSTLLGTDYYVRRKKPTVAGRELRGNCSLFLSGRQRVRLMVGTSRGRNDSFLKGCCSCQRQNTLILLCLTWIMRDRRVLLIFLLTSIEVVLLFYLGRGRDQWLFNAFVVLESMFCFFFLCWMDCRVTTLQISSMFEFRNELMNDPVLLL